jgi:hypothetical protein
VPAAPASSATAACSVSGASYLTPSIALPDPSFLIWIAIKSDFASQNND